MIYIKDRNLMARSLPPGSVGAEIGVQHGTFSEILLESNPSFLYLVDCWKHQIGPYEKDPANYQQDVQDTIFKSVGERFANRKVQIIRSYSLEAARFVDEPLDWVYLDADHSAPGVLSDLIIWSEKVKPGGVIMGHDFVDNGPSRKMGFGVIRAVESFCHLKGWRIAELTEEEWSSYKLVRV